MSRRWAPTGHGWIRTLDYGHIAVWMRPEPHGVTLALYAAGYFDAGAETWIVRLPRGSWIPGEVMDKPHRIRWVLKHHGDPAYGALSVDRQQVTPSHSRWHRRSNWNRQVWRYPLPRKIRNSLKVRP